MINNKFFRRLFSCFIIAFFLFASIGVGAAFFQYFKMSQSDLRNSQQAVFSQWSREADQTIDYMMRVNGNFIATEEFRVCLTSEKPKPYDLLKACQAYRKFQMGDSSIQNTRAGASAAVLRLHGQLVITPDGTASVDSYLKQIHYPGGAAELFAYFSQSGSRFGKNARLYQTSEDSPYLTIVQRGVYESVYVYLTFVTLEKEALFANVKGLTSSGTAVVLDGTVLAASAGADLEGLKAFLETTPLSEPLPKTEYRLDGQSFYLQSCQSLPFFYVYTARIGGTLRSDGFAVGRFLLVTACFLVFGVAGCYLVSRRLYRPVVRLLDRVGDTAFHGKDEFAYLEDVSIKIREDNAKLSENLLKTKELVRSEALRGFLYGTVSFAEFQRQVPDASLPWVKEPVTVGVLRIETERLHMAKELFATLTEVLLARLKRGFVKANGFETLNIEEGVYALLIGCGDMEQIKEFLVGELSAIQTEYDLFVSACLGDPAENPDGIHKSFSSARYVSEYQGMIGKDRYVLCPADLAYLREENYYYPLRLEHDLISFAVKGMEKEALSVLEELYEENFQKRVLSGEKVSLFLFALSATISRILEMLGRTPDIFGEKAVVYLELKMFREPAELRVKAAELFTILAREASSSSQKQDSTMAGQLIAYVRENYSRDLSLTDLSEKFNMSQGYISTLFKNLSGTNFKEYLSRLRFEKAVEILAQNPYTQTKDLAALVGLNTPKALIAIFNKYAGMSPKQYVGSHTGL